MVRRIGVGRPARLGTRPADSFAGQSSTLDGLPAPDAARRRLPAVDVIVPRRTVRGTNPF